MSPACIAPPALRTLFHDRADAGRRLARRLLRHRDTDALILALPRGGVPVAFEIARVLRLALEVLPVQRILLDDGMTSIGAIAFGGDPIIDRSDAAGAPNALDVDDQISVLREKLRRQARSFRGKSGPVKLSGRTVILVDDGLATGSSIRAAIAALSDEPPARLVVAVPVASAHACANLPSKIDEVVCVVAPVFFLSVARWYRDFSQVTDRQVRSLLEQVSDRQWLRPKRKPSRSSPVA